MFDGVAPSMSVRTSTPSPVSSWRTRSLAWGRSLSGSSCSATPIWRTCSSPLPRTWLALCSSASPKLPCETIRMPIMVAPELAARGLDRVEEHPGDAEAGLLRDLLEAGRAGDVDLGEPVADHVEADEEQPLRR